MSRLSKGYVQIYTGSGKGKTTAALGLALRAAGAGYRTYILQIMKSFPYSELQSLNKLSEHIEIWQCGSDEFVLENRMPTKEEKDIVLTALHKAKTIMTAGSHEIVILDEICAAIYFKLTTTGEALDFINARPDGVELILTGRYCPQELIDAADLVTDMTEVKHYYEQGVISRKGIDS